MLLIYNGLHKYSIFNTMTNAEKSIELAESFVKKLNWDCRVSEAAMLAAHMADWKDNQFKTELNRLRNRFHGEESHRAYFALETLNELYNKLFPNDNQPA